MRSPFPSTLLLAVSAAALPGCSFHLPAPGSWTPGEEGRANFSYVNLTSCFFGCELSRPLMAGTTESITIKGDALPAGLVFGTDDIDVLGVAEDTAPLQTCSCPHSGSCGPDDPHASCSFTYGVSVQALAPGKAQLLAVTGDGSLFDALPVSVVAPASLAFHCSSGAISGPAPNPVVTSLTLSQACPFHVDALDARNEVLQASSGFSITSTDTAVVFVTPSDYIDLFATRDEPVNDSDGTVYAAGSGSAAIDIRVGALSLTIPVTVP
jgi:hypothetical protein